MQHQSECIGDLRELGDPEFLRYWAELRYRITLSGEPVASELKREYQAVSPEYRRRMDGNDVR